MLGFNQNLNAVSPSYLTTLFICRDYVHGKINLALC
jgi:hypothetical protein